MEELHVLAGEVVFPCDLVAGDNAVLRVALQEVTRADAASVTTSSLLLPIARHLRAGECVRFVLEGLHVDARMRYEVRAHVDRSGNGRVEVDDLVSTESHPVLTRGYPAWISILLSPV